jgi:hypothetical protein
LEEGAAEEAYTAEEDAGDQQYPEEYVAAPLALTALDFCNLAAELDLFGNEGFQADAVTFALNGELAAAVSACKVLDAGHDDQAAAARRAYDFDAVDVHNDIILHANRCEGVVGVIRWARVADELFLHRQGAKFR